MNFEVFRKDSIIGLKAGTEVESMLEKIHSGCSVGDVMN